MPDFGPMSRLAQCRLYVSELQSDAGESPRNVCMLDVFVILACACFMCFCTSVRCRGKLEECLIVSGFRSDVGQGPRNVYMFMLCVYLCVFVDMLYVY